MANVTNNQQTALGDAMLALIRTKFPGYHPILAIAEMAHDASIDDNRLKLDCHKTIVKYVTPELKSIEVKAEIKETRRVIVSMFDGEDAAVIENPPQASFSRPDPLLEQLGMVDVGLEAEEVAA